MLPLKFWDICADGNVDPNFGYVFFFSIILRQPSPDVSSFYSNNRVIACDISRRAMEQIYSDRTLLEKIVMTTQAMFDHIGKEFLCPRAVAECVAVFNALQMFKNRGARILVRMRKLC